MIELGGDEVAPRDQLVALDGGVVGNRPAVVAKIIGIIVGTNQKTGSC